MHRIPVVYPTPAIELRLDRIVELEASLVTDQTQHKPDLLLTDAHGKPVAPDQVARQPISQPIPRTSDNLYMVRKQTCFLPKLAVHRLLGRFPGKDTTLRKLPRLLP